MQPIAQLVEQLERGGMSFWLEGDEIRFRGPQELVDSSVFDLLRHRKSEVAKFIARRKAIADLPPLSKGEKEAGLQPLGRAQQGWWELAVLGRELNHQACMKIDVPADVAPEQCKDALSQLVLRHDALRTLFQQDELGVRQRVSESLPSDFKVVQIGGFRSPQDLEELGRVRDAFISNPISLSEGPVLKALLCEANEGSILFLVFSRLLVDHYSQFLLQSDFMSLLRAQRQGVAAPQPAPYRYSDFLCWERKQSCSREHERHRTPPTTAGSFRSIKDKNIPPPWSCSSLSFALPTNAAGALQRLEDAYNIDRRTIALAVLCILLRTQWTPDPFIVGFMAPGRPPGTENVVGSFSYGAPLQLDVADNPTFSQILMRIQEEIGFANRPLDHLSPDEIRALRLHRVVFSILASTSDPSIDARMAEHFQVSQRKDFFQEAIFSLNISKTLVSGRFDFATELIEQSLMRGFVRQLPLLLDEATKSRDARYLEIVRRLNPSS